MLNGIKVLELGTMISAPFGAYLLADLGAAVTKVESRNGDPLRGLSSITSGNSSAFFDSVNQGKHSVFVDFSSPDYKIALDNHISDTDVFVHNYLPKTAKGLGFDYESVRAINPDVVYVSVNGFGSDTSYANKPGLDMVFQGLSGMMSLTGESGRPMRTPSPVIDMTTGLYAALMVSAALYRRSGGGGGAVIDVSMLSVALAMQAPLFHQFFSNEFKNLEKKPNRSHVSLSNCFKTRDGYINISITKLSQWGRLKSILPDLSFAVDESTYASLMESEDLIFSVLDEFVLEYSSSEISFMLDEIGVPSGEVLMFEDVMKSKYVHDAGAIYRSMESGNAYIRQPYKYNGQNLVEEKGVPPLDV